MPDNYDRLDNVLSSVKNDDVIFNNPLDDNNRLTFKSGADNYEVKSYKLAPTNNQFLKLSVKYFSDKLCLDFRKWKRDIWYGTNDFHPSDKGIMVSIDVLDDLITCLTDIKDSHLIDKSTR